MQKDSPIQLLSAEGWSAHLDTGETFPVIAWALLPDNSEVSDHTHFPPIKGVIWDKEGGFIYAEDCEGFESYIHK